MNSCAASRLSKLWGKTGENFFVLNHVSEYGLWFDTRGLEWDQVKCKSARSVATVLLVTAVEFNRK
jgi:hypothetical protein